MNDSAQVTTTPALVPLMPVDAVDFLDDDPANLRPSSETIARWLSEVGRLHRSTAGSPEFYADAARFAVEIVGLDAATVLAHRGGDWRIVGSAPPPADEFDFDQEALDFLSQEAVTWYQPQLAARDLRGRPQAAVVAPVLDRQGKLVAAIYGVRNTAGENQRRGIRPLEARLVQLLAESVSVGIARMDRETEAARARVLLDQAFSPTVAQFIQDHPHALVGQSREVSLLFADLCGFTSLSEELAPADCYDLLAGVMEVLTEIVIAKQGLVVDYYGDGLLAMWNAPLDQADHATLACSAGQEMFDCLLTTSDKWRDRLNGPLQLRVGVHTGPALVGNAGTRSRIKYGPRGHAVNIAHRVQAASKQLGLPLILTKATQKQLSDEFCSLRICTAKLPGLEQQLNLYTAYPACKKEQLDEHSRRYAEALEWFEAGNLVTAERLLAELHGDTSFAPANFLAKYLAKQLHAAQGRRVGDHTALNLGSVIELGGK